MQLWIETRGYSTATARSAAEAERLAEATLPRVVLADLCLPDRSGYTLLESLRKTEPLRQSFFIAFSGSKGEGEKERALEAGFDHFIAKPPDFEELSQVLQTFLRPRSQDQSGAEPVAT